MREQESQLIPIGLTLIAAVLGAFAQYFFKQGSLKLLEVSVLKNYYLIAGLFSFFLVLVLILASFRLGGRMMVIYPCYGSTYIWGLVISHYIDKEMVSLPQISGIALIIVGISLIAYQR